MTASPLWNNSVHTNEASHTFFFVCYPSFIKIDIRTVNDRYMFIFEILHVIWSVLSFFLVIFVKKKNHHFIYFCFMFCGCVMHFIQYLFNYLHCFLMLIKESHSLVSAFIWQTSYIYYIMCCRNIQSEIWLWTVK